MDTAMRMLGKQKMSGGQVCYMLDRAFELLEELRRDPILEKGLSELKTTGILKCKKKEDGSYSVKAYGGEEIAIPKNDAVTKGYAAPRESTFRVFLQDVKNACLPAVLDHLEEDSGCFMFRMCWGSAS